MRQHQGDLAAQQGEFRSASCADGLGLAQAGMHGGVKFIHFERLGQIIVRPQIHAMAHAVRIGQTGHENKWNGRRVAFHEACRA